MGQAEPGNRRKGIRSRFAHILSWLLFVRFPLLFAILFVALPFLATGPLSTFLGNLFLLDLGDLLGVTLLALLLGKALVLAAQTASAGGPIRLLPERVDDRRTANRTFVEQREIGFALAWDPEGALARVLYRWDERIAVALALPTIVFAVTESSEPQPGWEDAWVLWKGFAVGLAALAYVLLRAAASFLEGWFANPDAAPAARRTGAKGGGGPLAKLGERGLAKPPPWIARAFRRRVVGFLLLPTLRVGYVRERTAEEAHREFARRLEAGEPLEKILADDDPTLRYDLLPGHAAAIAFFGLIFSAYLALGALNYPGWTEPWFPMLGYVLLLLLGIGWGLSSLSFWYDRFRVPVLLAVFAFSLVTTRLGGGDHFFRLIEPPPPAEIVAPIEIEPETPPAEPSISADERRFVDRVRARCDRPIVAVAAAGGGITSAAWTAAVLTRLAEHEAGAEFLDALAIVSGVSGGSVGATFFLDGIAGRTPEDGRPLPAADGARIRDAASAPSLDWVGWGLAYPDLARLVVSPLVNVTMPLVDRSWALERSWEVRLAAAARARGEAEGGVPTLRSWRDATLRGALPAAILNATTVESGERFQMSTLRLTSGSGRSDFWEAYPGYDLAVATAARLSATFPFVSTAARARGCCGEVKPGAHFVDGGYYDNSGLLSALELLDRALGAFPDSDDCRPPVVIVRLEPFNDEALTLAQIEPASGWQSAAVSPIKALIAVRTATQVYRNNWESGIFAQKWRGRGFDVHEIELPLGGLGPLSWKLSGSEIARIERVAADAMTSNDALRLFALLEGHRSMLLQAEPALADAAARSELGKMQAN